MTQQNKISIQSVLRHQRPTMLKDANVKRTLVFDEFKSITITPSSNKSSAMRTSADGKKSLKRPMEPFIRSKSAILRSPDMLHDRNALNYKAAIFARATKPRIGASVSVKVGIVGSQSRLGQNIQGVGSVALPGDTSGVRSPLRSRLYSALTPGGSGIRRPHVNAPTRGYRCPFGFEFGGRFTDRNYSTCGAQLFELPSALGAVIGLGRRGSITPASAESLSQVIDNPVNAQQRAIQIMRMAQVPRSGAENAKVRSAAASQVIKTLTGAPSGESRLVRKDGVILRPVVSSSVLRNFGGNPDMENGVFVRAIDKPSDIIGDDLALLSGPAIMNVSYVTPNGSVIAIERQRPLTVGERRKFGRQLNRVAGSSDKYDVGNNIRDFANQSNGAFKYSEKFPNVNKPLDMVEVEDDNGKKIQVRRWVYETFMRDGAKGKNPKAVTNVQTLREDTVSVNETPKSLTEAVGMIDGGGDPFDISPDMLGDALSLSKKYEAQKLGSGITKYSNGNNVYWRVPETRKNGAIAERVYSDIGSQLGLQMPPVRLIGSSSSREAFVGDIDNNGNRTDFNISLDKVNANEMLKSFMSDYLADARDRSPATLRPVQASESTTVVPSSNDLSLLAGLNSADIAKRFKLEVADFLNSRGGSTYKNRFADLTAQERSSLLETYDTLIERAQKFDWESYISKISADGNLSSGEQAHLEMLKKLYGNRIEKLKNSKQLILTVLKV